MAKSIEDNNKEVKLEIEKISTTRVDEMNGIRSALENDIPKLQQGIKGLALERDEFNGKFAKKAAENIAKVKEEISHEKEISSDTEEILLNSIKEVVNNTKKDLANEKKSRETTEGMLMRLLEDASNKLPIQIKSPSKV